METREIIKNRRSIRRFTDQPISDWVLQELLEAIRWSPSWANTQCWEVIVVKDAATKEKLSEMLSPNNPATRGVVEAPVVMVMCGKKGAAGFKKGEPVTEIGDWYMFDVGIASQNLCLAAADLGLGTVHAGYVQHAKIAELLGVPEGVQVVEVIPVGYPVKEGTVVPRKEMETFVFQDRYGQKLK